MRRGDNDLVRPLSFGKQLVMSEMQRCAPHLKVMYYTDVSGGPGALGMVHNRVFLQTWDTARGQHLVVLIHTQGLSSQIFYW